METTSKPSVAGRRTLATLALSMLLASLGTSIANIALPTLTEAFGAPFRQIQWVVVAYLAAITFSSVFAGRLGDVFGLKRTYLIGAGLFSAASMLCGMAPDLWVLVFARAMQGVGAAFLMTLTIALVRETSTADRMGRAMGLLGTVSAIGTALGPTLGGFLVSATGWSGIFLVLVPAGLLTLLLATWSLPDGQRVAAATPFSLAPLIQAKLLSSLTANLLVAAVMMATLVAGPFYLSIGLGLSAPLAGLVMSVGPVVSIFGGVLSGRAVDRWGTHRILGIGLALLAVGAFSLGILPQALGTTGYVLAIAVLTPGYQLFQAANNTAVMAGAPKDLRGTTSGILGLSRNLGLVVGAWAMGTVFAFGVGTSEFVKATPAALDNGMLVTFGLAGAMMAIALWIVLREEQAGETAATT